MSKKLFFVFFYIDQNSLTAEKYSDANHNKPQQMH